MKSQVQETSPLHTDGLKTTNLKQSYVIAKITSRSRPGKKHQSLISFYSKVQSLPAYTECHSALQLISAGKWDDLYHYVHNKMRNCLHMWRPAYTNKNYHSGYWPLQIHSFEGHSSWRYSQKMWFHYLLITWNISSLRKQKCPFPV